MTTNPRRIAFDILLRIEREKSYADILLDHALSRKDIKGPDRGLLTELVYGVLRRQGTLDHITGLFSTKPVSKLEQAVLILLRLGLYQSFFLDRIPISAAVNETVKLAKEAAPRAAGFINAVLREADRQRENIVYPDRETDIVGYLSARFSHPQWLVREWTDQLGTAEAERLAEAMSGPPPLTIRTNTLKISRDELLNRLKEAGIPAIPTGCAPDGVNITTPTPLASLPGFQEGLFTVQDESSQLAAFLLGPEPGEKVLDLCAAPGGKATYLAQIMKNKGEITACDISSRKLDLITETAGRLGISTIETRCLDASKPIRSFEGTTFDRIMVDAPCSGLGVLRRHPEGKWRKRPEDVTALAGTQQLILSNAASCLKPGGVLLYATCSTSRAENERIIDNFLSRHAEFMLEDLRDIFPIFAELITQEGFFRSWPHRHGMDGFFAARLKRL